jgi:hypothetical protein
MPSTNSNDASESAGLQELRVRRHSPTVGSRDAFQELRVRFRQVIGSELEPGLDPADLNQLRPFVHERLNQLLGEQALLLNRAEKRQLLEAIVLDLSSSRM